MSKDEKTELTTIQLPKDLRERINMLRKPYAARMRQTISDYPLSGKARNFDVIYGAVALLEKELKVGGGNEKS